MKELEHIQMGGLIDKRIPGIYSLLSKAEVKRGDFVAAVAYLEKSIEIRKTSPRRNKSTLKDCLLRIVPLYGKVGCHEKAVAAYKEVLMLSSDLGKFEDNPGLRYKLGKLCVKAGKVTEAIGLYEEALPVLTASFDENYQDIFKTLFLLGNSYFEKGTYIHDRALGCYKGALAVAAKYDNVDQNERESIMNNMAFIFYSAGDLLASVEFFEKVIDNHVTRCGKSDRSYAIMTNNLANVLLRIGEADSAKAANDEAIRVRREFDGDNYVPAGSFTKKMGSLFLNMDDYDTAFACFQDALQAEEKTSGKESEQTVEIQRQIAKLHTIQKDWSEAKSKYIFVLACYSKSNRKDSEEAMLTMFQLGYISSKLGELRQAIGFYNSGLRICNNEERKATVLNSLGNVYMKQDKFSEALTTYRTSLDLKRVIFGENNKQVSRTLYNLGVVCQKMGDYEQATTYLQGALDANKRARHGDLHPRKVAKTMIDLGKVYYAKKMYVEAKKLFVDAEWTLREVKAPVSDRTIQSARKCLKRLEAREEKNTLKKTGNVSVSGSTSNTSTI